MVRRYSYYGASGRVDTRTFPSENACFGYVSFLEHLQPQRQKGYPQHGNPRKTDNAEGSPSTVPASDTTEAHGLLTPAPE